MLVQFGYVVRGTHKGVCNMIRKIFVRIKAVLRDISYAVKLAYLQERVIRTLKKQVLTSKRNPWVEYIAGHTSMNYHDAFDIYNFYCLHVVSTPESAKLFTNFVKDAAGYGFSASDIKLCLIMAHKPVNTEVGAAVMRKREGMEV